MTDKETEETTPWSMRLVVMLLLIILILFGGYLVNMVATDISNARIADAERFTVYSTECRENGGIPLNNAQTGWECRTAEGGFVDVVNSPLR